MPLSGLQDESASKSGGIQQRRYPQPCASTATLAGPLKALLARLRTVDELEIELLTASTSYTAGPSKAATYKLPFASKAMPCG